MGENNKKEKEKKRKFFYVLILLIRDQNLSSRQLRQILARCNLTLTLQPATCELHPLLTEFLFVDIPD